MSVRVVTHCYAKDLPQFAVFLRVQLSSLLFYPARHSVSVCYTESDERTMAVLDEFSPIFGLRLTRIPLDSGSLFRRSIGRNKAALHSLEDVVWFTDVDYWFDGGCLDHLNEIAKNGIFHSATMIWPRTINIHKDHSTGDQFWQQNLRASGCIIPDRTEFQPVSYNRAIGGIQIVSGEFARSYGYLNGVEKWQTPRTDNLPFKDFKDDIAYRKFCTTHDSALQAVSLDGVYRMRHTATTYQGK